MNHVELLKIAASLDHNKFYKYSDLILKKLAQDVNDFPFEIKEGLDYNDPKSVDGYFLGFAQDMVSRKPDITKKRVLMEVEKKFKDKYEEMSDDNKIAYSDYLETHLFPLLTQQDFYVDLAETQTKSVSTTFDPNSSGFENALNHILDVEGGYSAYNPTTKDPETNLGIIQSEYDSFRRSKGLDTQSVSNITYDEAKEIYYKDYWMPVQGDVLYSYLPKTAIAIFDFAVNSGIGGASSLVAKSLSIPSTRFDDNMINNILYVGENLNDGDDELASLLISKRYLNYEDIGRNQPEKGKAYGRGWKNRLEKLKKNIGLSDVV